MSEKSIMTYETVDLNEQARWSSWTRRSCPVK